MLLPLTRQKKSVGTLLATLSRRFSCPDTASVALSTLATYKARKTGRHTHAQRAGHMCGLHGARKQQQQVDRWSYILQQFWNLWCSHCQVFTKRMTCMLEQHREHHKAARISAIQPSHVQITLLQAIKPACSLAWRMPCSCMRTRGRLPVMPRAVQPLPLHKYNLPALRRHDHAPAACTQ
jgi:hypothetical protein